MRRFAAILALTGFLFPRLTLGEEVLSGAPPSALIFMAPVAAPAKAVDLTWRAPDGKDRLGVWLTADQEVKLGTKILSCQAGLNQSLDKNASCEVALATARGDSKLAAVPWWVWLLGGAAAGAGTVLIVRGAAK